MKAFYGYIRVSTPKQGLGVSLQEQRSAIEAFASRQGARIEEWFEEQETAAKRGRPVFGRMLRALRARKAHGVVMHKIDRSARNLKDWADLNDLIDSGTEIHFATESLDLGSRGGRLSADIQAVVAADYIRNLREETRKGFYGRLKQGIYPLRAPIGYRDCGRGKPKEIDQRLGPLVRRAFSLYATGAYSLDSLRNQLFDEGLVNHGGKVLSLNGMSTLLRNPFYTGVIRIRRDNSSYAGIHEPLISVETFEAVQRALSGRTAPRNRTHAFLFRRLLYCAVCHRVLTGELTKGRVYYRCHTRTCLGTCVREDRISTAVTHAWASATSFSSGELAEIQRELDKEKIRGADEAAASQQGLALRLTQIQQKLDKVTDALIDGLIDKAAYESRKERLLLDQQRIRGQLDGDPFLAEVSKKAEEIFELLKRLSLSTGTMPSADLRELIERTTSNFLVDRKDVVVELRSPLREFQNRRFLPACDQHRGAIRTFAPVTNPKPLSARDVAGLILTSAKAAAKAASEDRPLAA